MTQRLRTVAATSLRYSDHYSDVAKTTIQLDKETHKRLSDVKDDLTFDEAISLMLDMLDPQDIRAAREARQKAYEEWQRQMASAIRSNPTNKRLF